MRTRALYLIILLTVAGLTLMFALSSAHSGAGPIAVQGDSSTGSLFNTNHAELNNPGQPESSGTMMAQEHHEEHYCVGHCRKHYEERLAECSEPGHPHHHRCEEWAREREHECLDACYHEHPRY
ncbi:exported hypothetical protein [Syntrophobacter sp. SbD1]|nr:exported hypothetical protein [Syntrophobacter sp. SbD1]